MDDLETAKHLHAQARLAVRNADAAWSAAKKAALVELELVHAPVLRLAEQAFVEAARVLKEATSSATPDHEWEGRRVYQMRQQSTSNIWARRGPDVRVEGIVETVRPTSKFAENLSRYSRPDVGDVIVRLLKKDGTAAIRFERFHSHRPWSLVETQAVPSVSEEA